LGKATAGGVRTSPSLGASDGTLTNEQLNPDSPDFLPPARKKKKPNIWEIIERKKQTTNTKQKKAKAKSADYNSGKGNGGKGKGKGKRR
jgi:hypothetical protein